MIAHSSTIEHLAVVATGTAALGVYGWAWLLGRKRSVVRLAAWSTAILVVLVATTPTVEAWSARTFTGHMGQHLAMIVVAAPLFVVARPVQTVGPLLRIREHRPSRWWRPRSVMLTPLLFLGVLYLTHLTSIYELALDHRLVHDLEHVAYLGTAVALWAAITAPRPSDGVKRVGAALGVIGGTALLGVVLLSAGEPLVPTYVESLGAEEALNDQRRAASFMWAGGMGLTLPLLLASVWVWASSEERAVRRHESLTGASPGAPDGRFAATGPSQQSG